jgi:hypothetical protein
MQSDCAHFAKASPKGAAFSPLYASSHVISFSVVAWKIEGKKHWGYWERKRKLLPPVCSGFSYSLGLHYLCGRMSSVGCFTDKIRVNSHRAEKLTFTDPQKIKEVAIRGEAWGRSEVKANAGTCD